MQASVSSPAFRLFRIFTRCTQVLYLIFRLLDPATGDLLAAVHTCARWRSVGISLLFHTIVVRREHTLRLPVPDEAAFGDVAAGVVIPPSHELLTLPPRHTQQFVLAARIHP